LGNHPSDPNLKNHWEGVGRDTKLNVKGKKIKNTGGGGQRGIGTKQTITGRDKGFCSFGCGVWEKAVKARRRSRGGGGGGKQDHPRKLNWKKRKNEVQEGEPTGHEATRAEHWFGSLPAKKF